jgi:hypothetical protein
MNAFDKYNKIRQKIQAYRNVLAEYDGKVATKKVLAALDKILKEEN